MIILRPHTSSRPGPKHKLRGLAAALLFVITAATSAQEPSESPPTGDAGTTWRMVIEPAFMRPDYAVPIEGTKASVLAPALLRDGELTPLRKADAERLKIDLESVRRLASAAASADLAGLEPEYVRDDRNVALYARLTSDSPIVASAVLAPDFIAKFADVLGPDLLVAVPNRYRAYVYPALASRFQDTAGLVLRDYELSPYPVSREIFRVTPRGLRAMGAFEPR